VTFLERAQWLAKHDFAFWPMETGCIPVKWAPGFGPMFRPANDSSEAA
jgi:hypothetical protein